MNLNHIVKEFKDSSHLCCFAKDNNDDAINELLKYGEFIYLESTVLSEIDDNGKTCDVNGYIAYIHISFLNGDKTMIMDFCYKLIKKYSFHCHDIRTIYKNRSLS